MSLVYNPEKERRRRQEFIQKKIARHVLLALRITAGVAALVMSPFGLHFLVKGAIRYYFHTEKTQRELWKLKRKGFIAVTKTPDGYLIKLLKKGKQKLRHMQIETLILPTTKKWDGKWRIFIFDIPERAKLARDTLTTKLKELGMFHVQRSVFIYPFDCRKELEFLSDSFGVLKYTSFGEITKIDIESELQKNFAKLLN